MGCARAVEVRSSNRPTIGTVPVRAICINLRGHIIPRKTMKRWASSRLVRRLHDDRDDHVHDVAGRQIASRSMDDKCHGGTWFPTIGVPAATTK